MALECVHVLYQYCLILLPAGPAYSMAQEYFSASRWALKRAQHQLVRMHEVVPDPPPLELCMEKGQQIVTIGLRMIGLINPILELLQYMLILQLLVGSLKGDEIFTHLRLSDTDNQLKSFGILYQSQHLMKQTAVDLNSASPSTFEFISSSSQFLNCKICCNLMKQPIRLHRCGHTFCASCVQSKQIKNCPICTEKILNKQKDLLASKLVGELAVRCLNADCPWKGSYQQFLNFHEKSCGLKDGGIEGWLKQLQNAISENTIGLKKTDSDQEQQPEPQTVKDRLPPPSENPGDELAKNRDKQIDRVHKQRLALQKQKSALQKDDEQVDQIVEKRIKNISK